MTSTFFVLLYVNVAAPSIPNTKQADSKSTHAAAPKSRKSAQKYRRASYDKKNRESKGFPVFS